MAGFFMIRALEFLLPLIRCMTALSLLAQLATMQWCGSRIPALQARFGVSNR